VIHKFDGADYASAKLNGFGAPRSSDVQVWNVDGAATPEAGFVRTISSVGVLPCLVPTGRFRLPDTVPCRQIPPPVEMGGEVVAEVAGVGGGPVDQR